MRVTPSMGVEHWVQPGAHVLQQAVIFFSKRGRDICMHVCLPYGIMPIIHPWLSWISSIIFMITMHRF